jgi:hypothetical protein
MEQSSAKPMLAKLRARISSHRAPARQMQSRRISASAACFAALARPAVCSHDGERPYSTADQRHQPAEREPSRPLSS